MGGLLQLPPTARSSRRADPLRTAPCEDRQAVTCVLRPYIVLIGGQGRNRTTDTRIFSPQESAPRNTQRHLKQPFRRNRPPVTCSWVTVGNARLETKVETDRRYGAGSR